MGKITKTEQQTIYGVVYVSDKGQTEKMGTTANKTKEYKPIGGPDLDDVVNQLLHDLKQRGFQNEHRYNSAMVVAYHPDGTEETVRHYELKWVEKEPDEPEVCHKCGEALTRCGQLAKCGSCGALA